MPGLAYEAYVYVKPQRERAKGFGRDYSLLCLLMMVLSLRRHDADGLREHTAGARRRGTLQGNALGEVTSPPYVTAAVIQKEFSFSFIKHTRKWLIYEKRNSIIYHNACTAYVWIHNNMRIRQYKYYMFLWHKFFLGQNNLYSIKLQHVSSLVGFPSLLKADMK